MDIVAYLLAKKKEGGSGTAPSLQEKIITINGEVTPDYGYDGLSKVTVNVPDASKAYLKSLIDRSVTTLEFPEDLTSIGDAAFRGCTNLVLTSLPSGITSIGTNTFYQCSNLALTHLPSGLVRIGTYAFMNCHNLALTELPSGLNTLGMGAFCGCTGLAITEIPSSITSIGANVFSGCTGITSLTFRGTPSSIHNLALNNCNNLTIINVPWAEGEVANAPWGATNATINYGYVPSESES